MANAEIGVTNLADASTSTVSVSGSTALNGASKLINPHVANKWQINADTGYVQIDLASSTALTNAMLAGVTGSNPSFRVRGGPNSDMSSPTFDSGTISGTPYFDPNYGLFVYRRASASVRYVRIDVSETGVSSIAAGRVGLFALDAFTINFQTPWARSAMRGSVATPGVGGQTFIDLRRGYWSQRAQFGFITEAERTGFLERLGVAIVNEGHRDILWVPNPDSTNLSRDCLWGYVDSDITLTYDKYNVDYPYAAEFMIRQRR